MSTLTISVPWTTLAVADTTPAFFPSGAWRASSGFTGARATLEVAAMVGTPIEVVAAFEVCNTPDSPGADTAIGSYLTSVDVQYPSSWDDITSAVQGTQLLRPGFLVKRTSGTGTVLARAAAVIEFKTC